MDEDAKKTIAVFRFGVIADLVGGRKLLRGEKEALLREKASLQWEIPFSLRSHISRSTILSWMRSYEKGGRRLESLYPEERKDKGRYRVMDEEAIAALIQLRKERMGITLPVLLKEARAKGILPPHYMVSYATIYRIFRQHGVSENHIYPDRRRFEAELPNDIWQSDALHGPKALHEGKLKKTYCFAFIDDMSRLIPHAAFYVNERIDCYIDALTKALAKRGLPRKLYVDNGPAFSTQLLRHATASLGIALVHSAPYQPEGRGKIERWFKTLRMQFLSTIPDGLALEELNKRLAAWIEEYHLREHGTTNEAPFARYARHLHCIREAPRNLMDHFRKRVTRKVDRDRTISLDGRLFEAPVTLIGKTVTLLYHESDPSRVEVFFNGTSHGRVLPLDVHVNAKVKRANQAVDLIPDAAYHQEEEHYRGGRVFEREEP